MTEVVQILKGINVIDDVAVFYDYAEDNGVAGINFGGRWWPMIELRRKLDAGTTCLYVVCDALCGSGKISWHIIEATLERIEMTEPEQRASET